MTLTSCLLTLPVIGFLVVPLVAGSIDQDQERSRCQRCFECAIESARPTVVRVKLYNQSRLSEANLEQMLATTNRIWTAYGISIEADASPNGVAVIVAGRSLSTPDAYQRPVLGTTLFTNGHATPYIHLWLGTVEALAVDADSEGRPFKTRSPKEQDAILLQMMGVALAHELGHYLLDTKQHSSAGLLQATVSLRNLRHPELAHLGLTSEQRRLLCGDVTLAPSR
jgi:hypothetical protein